MPKLSFFVIDVKATGIYILMILLSHGKYYK